MTTSHFEPGRAVAAMRSFAMPSSLHHVEVTGFNDQSRRDAISYSLKERGSGFRLSEHFTLKEFACNDGSDIVTVHPAVILLAEMVRRQFNAPVRVHSGFRTPEHNARIGGKPNSRHLRGMAMDVSVHEVTPYVVQKYLEGLHVGGLGYYHTFTHFDVQGLRRRWGPALP